MCTRGAHSRAGKRKTARARGSRLSPTTVALPALITALLAAAPAQAEREYYLPSHITIETQAFSFPNDPERCVAWAFAEFPEIPRAKGYEITVADTVHGTQETYSGPEFPDDTWSDYPALYQVHPGFHWFALSGYSVGTGCADAILAFEGAYEIARARVHLDRKYEKRLRPKRGTWKLQRCHGAGGKLPRIGKPGGVLFLKRIGGGVTFRNEDELQPINLHDGAFVDGATIVKTDRHSAVMVGVPTPEPFFPPSTEDLNNQKTEVMVFGPGMEIRLEPGKRPEVLHRDPDASWNDVKPVMWEGHTPGAGDAGPGCPRG